MRFLLLLLTIFFFLSCKKELTTLSVERNIKQDFICDISGKKEECPEFIGGVAEFYKYISKHLLYKGETKVHISVCNYSKMLIQFDILENGKVDEIIITQKTGWCPTLEEQVRLVFQNMPIWKPAKQNNKSVKSTAKVTLSWHLDND
jgi:hypothetical protein